MKLENIGFYTLSNKRAKELKYNSNLQRAEILLNNICNFDCIYCRDKKADYQIDYQIVIEYIKMLEKNNLYAIRLSGGEPTLYKQLINIVRFIKVHTQIQKIAISTNGSADLSYYKQLISAGVNDLSVSLDSCCSDIANKMAGKNIDFDKICNNIQELSKICYTTIGIVLNEKNIDNIQDIINFCNKLNPSDIRIIPSAQFNNKLYDFKIDKKILKSYPILKYRIKNILKNKTVRGLSIKDNKKCPLILDDLAIRGNFHYPCIIKLREGCDPIGKINNLFRRDRMHYYNNHNIYEDKICMKNCLDVCRDYNNMVKKLNKNIN